MLTDRINDGLSAVYSFFDPDEGGRSLGTHMVLRLIEKARLLGLRYVYLGFWIKDSQKMAYKATFPPLEMYTPEGWKPLTLKGNT
jgi:arginine-tRNA-protein transferase